ncbi:MAG: esterase-like activity of phytase family protein [Myxococcota bacterium]
MTLRFRLAPALLLASTIFLSGSSPAGVTVRVETEDPQPVMLLPGVEDELGLSGITWLGEDRYLAVGDHPSRLYFLRITIDGASGTIDNAELERTVPLEGASDPEAVVYHPERGTCFIAEEVTDDPEAVHEHDCREGKRLEAPALSEHLLRSRRNRGLEALVYDESIDAFFTANEGPLEGDGPAADARHGAWLRLFAFGPETGPVVEWAYRVDAIPGDVPLFNREVSGVTALQSLSDGRLLVLERALGAVGPFGLPGFRHRLYVATPDSDSDATLVTNLPADDVRPMTKRRVWEGHLGPVFNFEGMTFGPELEDGTRLLLLVSDDGGGLARALLPLRVRTGD